MTKGKEKATHADGTPSNSSHAIDGDANLIDNSEQTKLETDASLHHQQCTTNDVRPDDTPPQQLPNEILTLIMHHLTHQGRQTLFECTLITKQFHAIANPLLWQEINFGNNDNITERFLAGIPDAPQQRLETLGQHVRKLRLKGTLWTDAHLIRLLPHLPNLDHLSINRTIHITDTSFQYIPRYCHQLTSLNLYDTCLTQEFFSAIGQYCHRLCELRWFVTRNQSPECLVLLKDCPLERLTIMSAFFPLSENAIAIIKHFDGLTRLYISGTSLSPMNDLLLATTTPTNTNTSTDNPPPAPPLDDDDHGMNTTAATTIRRWPQLTELMLYPCNGIDEPTLIGFIKSHRHLRLLRLTVAKTLTDASLHAMAKWLPNLTHMFMTGNDTISPQGVRRLVQESPPSLVSAIFESCHRLVTPNHGFPEHTTRGMVVHLNQKAIEEIRQGVQRE